MSIEDYPSIKVVVVGDSALGKIFLMIHYTEKVLRMKLFLAIFNNTSEQYVVFFA